MKTFKAKDTIENNNVLEIMVAYIKRYELAYKTFLNPVTLGDGYKLTTLMNAEFLERNEHPEEAKKFRDFVTKIVEKEEQKKSQKEIDKVYFEVYSQEPSLIIHSLSYFSEALEENMLSVRKFNNKDVEKRIKKAWAEFISFIDEASLFLPLNHIEKLNKFHKMIVQFNDKADVFYNATIKENLSCSLVFCRVDQQD